MAEKSANVSVLVTCPMCLNAFDSPTSLPCGHAFCLPCIKRHCKDKVPVSKSFCPLCKQNFQVPTEGVEELPRNHYLQRLVDVMKSSCQRQISEKANDRELDAMSARVRGVYCAKHDEQVTTSHCFDCQENICTSCVNTHHRTHALKNIETFAAELKPQIESAVAKVSSLVNDIGSEAKRLRTQKEHLIEDVRRQETAIKKKGEELKSVIDVKVEELSQELERIKNDSLNYAQLVDNRLQHAAETVQSYCEYLQEIYSRGKSHDIVRYADAIHAHSEHLLEDRLTREQYAAPCVVFTPADAEHITTRQLLGYVSTPLSSAGLLYPYFLA